MAKYIVGIDEVGRGPIAGPVAVCAFLIKDDIFLKTSKEKKLPKLKDSKKLSKKQREEWFRYLKVAKTEGLCDFAVSFVSSKNIDRFGITKCIQKALDESLKEIATRGIQNFPRFTQNTGAYTDENLESPVSLASFNIFLDGGLKAPIEYINQKTIIRGDELHPVISCASIMAKVMRDKVMTDFAKVHKNYGFEKHSGYGTKDHYSAIKKHGQTSIHRKTFIH